MSSRAPAAGGRPSRKQPFRRHSGRRQQRRRRPKSTHGNDVRRSGRKTLAHCGWNCLDATLPDRELNRNARLESDFTRSPRHHRTPASCRFRPPRQPPNLRFRPLESPRRYCVGSISPGRHVLSKNAFSAPCRRKMAFQLQPGTVSTQLSAEPAGAFGPNHTSIEPSALVLRSLVWLPTPGTCWSVWAIDRV